MLKRQNISHNVVVLWTQTSFLNVSAGPYSEREDSDPNGLSGRVQSGGDGTHHASHGARADPAAETRSEGWILCGSVHAWAHCCPQCNHQPNIWTGDTGMWFDRHLHLADAFVQRHFDVLKHLLHYSQEDVVQDLGRCGLQQGTVQQLAVPTTLGRSALRQLHMRGHSYSWRSWDPSRPAVTACEEPTTGHVF